MKLNTCYHHRKSFPNYLLTTEKVILDPRLWDVSHVFHILPTSFPNSEMLGNFSNLGPTWTNQCYLKITFYHESYLLIPISSPWFSQNFRKLSPGWHFPWKFQPTRHPKLTRTLPNGISKNCSCPKLGISDTLPHLRNRSSAENPSFRASDFFGKNEHIFAAENLPKISPIFLNLSDANLPHFFFFKGIRYKKISKQRNGTIKTIIFL